jgi:hypothetical protein
MSYLISDAEKKSLQARRQVEMANEELQSAISAKDLQIAFYKEKVETFRAITEKEKNVLAEVLLTDAKKENAKALVFGNALSFFLGIVASLIAMHFYPIMVSIASNTGSKIRLKVKRDKLDGAA